MKRSLALLGFALSCGMAAPVTTLAAPNAATAPAKAPEIAGRVVSPTGQSVAGAQVSWVALNFDKETELKPRVVATATTDSNGEYRFENSKRLIEQSTKQGKNGAREGRVYLLAQAPGFAISPAEIDAQTITLNETVPVERSFVDDQGAPVAAIAVQPRMLVGRRGLFQFYPLPESIAKALAARSDADGKVEIKGLPTNFQAQLEVSTPDWAPLDYEQNTARPGENALPIQLVRPANVSGRVTTPDGQPVVGAHIGAQSSGAGGGWGNGTTGADGTYKLERMRPGTYNVILDLKKTRWAANWTGRAHENLVLGAGQNAKNQNFTLEKGGIVRGHVLSADGKTPVVGQPIGIYGPAHPKSSAWVQVATTDAKGAFSLRVPGGRQFIYLQSEPVGGFGRPAVAPTATVKIAPASSGVAGPFSSYNLSVKDGEIARIEWKLPRGLAPKPIWVLALDGAGQPVAGAQILQTDDFGDNPVGTTDVGGRLQLKDVRKSVTLRARKGDAITPKVAMALPGERAVLHLKARGMASLKGRVTDEKGQPFAGAKVGLTTWTYDIGLGDRNVTTNAQGRFVLDELWPDKSYSVSATAPGYGKAETGGHIQLKAGETRDLKTFKMPRADSFVAGRVVDEKGEGIAGASINLQGVSTPFQEMLSDAKGHFRFNNVVASDPYLSMGAGLGRSGPNARSAYKENVKAGTGDLVFILRAPNAQKQASVAESGPTETVEQLAGKSAPPLRAVSWLNSPALGADKLRGKIVLVDFWGIGCGPCVAELPGVERAWQLLKGKGVVFVGLHDSGATPAELKKFAREKGLTFPLAIDAEAKKDGYFGATFQDWGIVGIPTSAVIGRDGHVLYAGHSLQTAVETATQALAR